MARSKNAVYSEKNVMLPEDKQVTIRVFVDRTTSLPSENFYFNWTRRQYRWNMNAKLQFTAATSRSVQPLKYSR
jgi:hypothetical protein